MAEVTVRPVGPDDLPDVVEMVHELAAFEKAPESCQLTVPQLRSALFSEHPALYGHVALAHDGGSHRAVGFALWFLNFSTWDGTHGIYLEDLYVRESARGGGTGRRLLATLAATCVDRGYTRLQWSVLDWNPAREFYRALGAEETEDWVPCRVTGAALSRLAGVGDGRTPAAGERCRAGTGGGGTGTGAGAGDTGGGGVGAGSAGGGG